MSENATEYTFNTDIKQMMHLIVNAFYSKKDIFIRELISNASDALTKLKQHYLQHPDSKPSNEDVSSIRLKVCKDLGRLYIADNGIGMTRQELVDNIGTIAHSGTKDFITKLESASASSDMIGQFGVGFYSGFLVADRMDVISTSVTSGDTLVWSSDASSSFTIQSLEDSDYSREDLYFGTSPGTTIVLHLKDTERDLYLQDSHLCSVVKEHSQFISHPIWVECTKTKEEEVETEEDMEKEGEEDDKPSIEDVTDEPEESTKQTRTVSYQEWEQQNTQKPIWVEAPSSLSKETYDAFYKVISKDYDTPLSHLHVTIEGQYEFTSIVFIPKRAPFDMFETKKDKTNMKLYVRRVFITDDCKELLPSYLSFVTGMVDSQDLPLNVSREILQQNKVMNVIKKTLTKRILKHLKGLETGAYMEFYKQFSKNIKLGVHEDTTNRNTLVDLLRFPSTRSNADLVSLKDYVDKMPEEQAAIYFITGENRAVVESSPFMEQLKARGFEVLLMIDPIDEYVMQQVKEYAGKKFVSITKEGLTFGKEATEKTESDSDVDVERVCKIVKHVLGASVEKVVASVRLVTSPCCLVTNEYGWSANMERIMKAQALQDNSMSQFMLSKKILEINPKHALMRSIHDCACTDAEGSVTDVPARIVSMIHIMYETSLLQSGFSIPSPHVYSDRIFTLLEQGQDILSTMAVPEPTAEEKQPSTVDGLLPSLEEEDDDLPDLEVADSVADTNEQPDQSDGLAPVLEEKDGVFSDLGENDTATTGEV